MISDDELGPGTLDLIGQTVLIRLTAYETNVPASPEPTDVARAEFTVLTGEYRGYRTHEDRRRVFFGLIASTLIAEIPVGDCAVATFTPKPPNADTFTHAGIVVTTDPGAIKRARAQARRDALVGVQLTLDGVPS